MQLIFTGPERQAVSLHRILKADGIDAVCMTGTDHPTGAVFVPAADAKNRRSINRAIERTERELEAEGTANKDTHERAADELRWRARELPDARGSLRYLPTGRKDSSAEASADQVLPRTVPHPETSSSSLVRTEPGDRARAPEPRYRAGR